ncbi:MAG TPA: preprotein translocase subunit SecE [Solirubrobacterales bacterium]|jgi:preprotein translocase SecE subunit
MAKSRAQRKAERRAREAEGSGDAGAKRAEEARAQHDTQVPVSGDIAEIEAVEAGIAAGAPESQLETPDAPKQTRGERRAEVKRAKDAEKRQREDRKRKEREQLAKRQKQAAAERPRRGAFAFLASCWAELRKVQWPDRDTLVQATAVTIIFVTVAAAYLGALDGVFSFVIQRIL